MKTEQVIAEVEVRYRGKTFRLKCLVDSGTSRSLISKRLSDELGAFTPLEKPYELRTAEGKGKLRIAGFCNLDVTFQGVEVPGGSRFEVVENLREDLDVVIGRPEIDAWDIIFTPDGPRLKKTPIEFEVV